MLILIATPRISFLKSREEVKLQENDSARYIRVI